MLNIKEMVQLENHIKIDNKKFIILHDDDDLNEIFKSKEKIRSLKKIYKPSFVFLSKDQVKKLNECGVKDTTIPDYYFAEELRERSEERRVGKESKVGGGGRVVEVRGR